MPGFEIIPYNDLGALEAALEADPNIVAFMVEPIQVWVVQGWTGEQGMHCGRRDPQRRRGIGDAKGASEWEAGVRLPPGHPFLVFSSVGELALAAKASCSLPQHHPQPHPAIPPLTRAGEAGVVVPDPGYLAKAKALLQKHRAADRGRGQTGLLPHGQDDGLPTDDVRPDMLILGKALSGGTMPISAVLADDEVMLGIGRGQHAPPAATLAAKVAVASLRVLVDEGLAEPRRVWASPSAPRVRAIDTPLLESVRGKGLLNAIVIDESRAAPPGSCAWTWRAAASSPSPHTATSSASPPRSSSPRSS